jgi:hypothetical protein
MSNLFAFTSHGSPTLFGTGSEAEARTLCAQMNRDRATNHVVVQPVTEAEAGIEPIFDIAAEIERSRAVIAEAIRKDGAINSSRG